jgi:threonine dehydrogenase-like Zn-dependent dehydrogenase
MKTRSVLLAVLLAGALGVSAVACSSNDDKADEATTTTAADVTTTTTDDDDDTTTTTADDDGAPCTADALALAGAASGPEGNFDEVTQFECDGGYAYAWLVDSSNPDGPIISEIFQDDGGEWSAVTGPLCDGTAAGNVPTEILDAGCTYAS